MRFIKDSINLELMKDRINNASFAKCFEARIPAPEKKEERTRIDGSFPATIRGFDESGCMFRTNSSVDSISSMGMHVLLHRRVAAGSQLDAVVRLDSGARIAARGKVVGVDRLSSGLFGIAVRFGRKKLLQRKVT
jgi:hypothetical protein